MASEPFQTRSGLRSGLRVVLVGHEKVGKSSAGNTILGKKEFKCKMSSIPQTQSSEKREEDVLGRRVTVVDTPGLFSTQLSEEEVKAELVKAVDLSSPGPHVFLLTIQLGRYTEQEQTVLKTLEKMLSPDVSKHTMVLFTYGDRLEDTDMDQFIREDQNLQKLLKKCSGQYHVFNNREIGNRNQVQQLFDKIDKISNGGQCIYQRKAPPSGWFSWISAPLKNHKEENVSSQGKGDEEGKSGEGRGDEERCGKNKETEHRKQGEAMKEDQRDDTRNETEDTGRQSEKPQEAEEQEKMRDSGEESQTEKDEGKRKKRKHRKEDKDMKGETDNSESDGARNEVKMEKETLKEEMGRNGDKEELEIPPGPTAFTT